MTSTEKQYWVGELTDAELDAGDRYLVRAVIENELSPSDFVCEIRYKN